MATKRDWLGRVLLSGGRRRHGMFLVAAILGLLSGGCAYLFVPDLAVVIGAITLFAVYLALVALVMPVLTGPFLRSRAAEADIPVAVIFGVVLATVAVCCATLFMALNRQGGTVALELSLSIVSVLLGWFTIHTMAALHYAYEYYEPTPRISGHGSKPSGGLAFPDDHEPDAVEFLYFSYVIGVAFAVSDVQVHSRKMRRLVLIHSTFAYFFNTLILAATVNVAVAVGS
ncbi:Uncharacterized membrane protein [Devosia lucknowensis]|uniref:Uncharacterized membrane protein n=1 Tax=Devosia lucknowensis TaxID=1096929 RepID=A0A1Y6ETC8_9HYPH|nr:DUF1345 domain-containing protein [Devosia lucknowensis]SMQ65998.1 Uncharacterized membrane protein [Devosia lucknowensis]